MALSILRLAGLMGGHPSIWQRAQRRAPNPQAHRVRRHKRSSAERARPGDAKAVILPWRPSACPKCNSPCLYDLGPEVGCPLCGWVQLVQP